MGADKFRQHNCTLYGIKWPTEPIRYLGIYIGHDNQACHKLNFDRKVQHIENVLKQYKQRKLTLFGKVCAIKSRALASFMYTATCLPVPEKTVKEINQKIFRFLWGKRDRIKRKSIINKLEHGGLNMVDVSSQINAIQATWVHRITTASDDHIWSYLPKRYLSKFGDNFAILNTTVTEKAKLAILNLIPEFYRHIIISFNKAKGVNSDDFYHSLKEQMIWGNNFITYKKKCLYFKSWIDDGIIWIKDLKINDGDLDVQYLFNRLTNKQNFHIEVNMLSAALKKTHTNIYTNPMNEMTENNNSNKVNYVSCKQFYSKIIKTITEKPSAEKILVRFYSCKN